MSKLFTVNNVVKTAEFPIVMPIASLLIKTTRPLVDIQNETIKVTIERPRMKTKIICDDIPLKDLLLMSTYGNPALFKPIGESFEVAGLCELTPTPNLGIFLTDGAEIKVSMNNLVPAHTYEVHYVPESLTTPEFCKYDRMFMKAGLKKQEYNVDGYDVLCIKNPSEIEEILFNYDTEKHQNTFTIDILRAISMDTDPFMYNNNGVVVSQLADRLVLPLVGVSSITVKTVDGAGDIVMWALENDHDAEGQYNHLIKVSKDRD